ncbi:MAG: 30S ribosomal protein S20 [Verrucomicrobiota bacterium]|nr:30S ribosomal protein S20 [Verrucomicrobiota bacterium]
MANTKSAAKRSRQTATRTTRNRSILSGLRRMQKKAVGSGAAAKDEGGLRNLVSAIDKAAKRGTIHRNAANRRKARLNKARMAAAPATAAPAPSA